MHRGKCLGSIRFDKRSSPSSCVSVTSLTSLCMDCNVVSDSWYSLSNDKVLLMLFVVVDRVDGEVMDPLISALPSAADDGPLGSLAEELCLGESKPVCFPSQQSSLAMKTTSSHSPAARRRGSISLRPISSLTTSVSSTPRKIFMACIFAASLRDSRMD